MSKSNSFKYQADQLNNYLHEEGATQLDQVKTIPNSLLQTAGDRVAGNLLLSLGSALVVGFLLGKCTGACGSS